MRGIQHIDERSTSVADWLVRFYDTNFFWVVVVAFVVVLVLLIVEICRLYYETKEALEDLKDEDSDLR